jgi:acyl-CoA thioesterase
MSIQEQVVRWRDASEVRSIVLTTDGLAYAEGVRDGRLPIDPLLSVLGARITAVDGPGRLVLTATPGAGHLNLGGLVHGGFLSAVMDGALGMAVHSTLPAGQSCPHLQASYRFVTAALAGAELTFTAEVLRSGRRIGHARATVTTADGTLVATGESTHAVVSVAEFS